MNFGAFAGGMASGFQTGMQLGKSIRDVIKERKLQDLREQGMAEAEAQRSKSVQSMIKENNDAGQSALPQAPVSEPNTPASEAEAQGLTVASPVRAPEGEVRPLPALSAPTANPDAAGAKTAAASMTPATPSQVSAASPTANPDAAGAATAGAQMAPSVSTQTPSEPASTATVKPTPTQASQAQPASPTQAVAGQGVPGATKPPKFFVNGIGYETREQAMAAANKSVPSTMDYFMKNAVPKIAEQYMVNGDPATAKAWSDYAESHNGKRAIKDWAAAYSAPDFDTAVSRFGKYYTDHINDGVDYAGHTMRVKEDGSQVAIVQLKDKATGKTSEMELTREKMLALGGQNNPQHLFETEMARQREAEKLKLQAGLKAQERRENNQDKLTIEGFKQDRIDKREGIKQKNDADMEKLRQDRMDQREKLKSDLGIKEAGGRKQAQIDTSIDALIAAGKTKEEIEALMPAIIGIGEHKKTTDPVERRALITSDLMKNDPKFARGSKEEQNKRIDEMMGLIYGGSDQPAQTGKTTGQPTPAASPNVKGEANTQVKGVATQPMAFDPKLPVYRGKNTNTRYHLIDGQMVPIASPTTPQAGGMPKK